MKQPRTVLNEYCYVIQNICTHTKCKNCDELKQPDKDDNGNL